MMQVISLGMGLKSVALYLMSSMGQLPRADYAVFSDTGRESTATYTYLHFLKAWQQANNGIKILICREKNLYSDLLAATGTKDVTPIPAFMMAGDGSAIMLKKQCTQQYKTSAVHKVIRELVYHLSPSAKMPPTAIWYGISLDEAEHITVPAEGWKTNVFPFAGRSIHTGGDVHEMNWSRPFTRPEIVQWYLLHGLPIPPVSGCVFCPYSSDRSWALMKKNAPEDFAAAVKADEAIRYSTRKRFHLPLYLHHSCRPLSEAAFDIDREESWGRCWDTGSVSKK